MGRDASHRWKFFRAGGVDQVQIRDGADVGNLDQLDQKLWIALACPTKGLEFDKKTLEILDLDKDGRIRAREVLTTIQWLKDALASLDELFLPGDSLSLAALGATPLGKALHAGARRILHDLGKPTATSIALADVASTEKIFAATRFNGDGIVPVESAGDDESLRKVLADVIATHGSTPDRSGKPGVDQARVDAFFAEASALVAWAAKPGADPAIRPIGEATDVAARAVAAVKVKVDDWFTRGRLAAFDSRAAAVLNRAEAELAALAPLDLSDGHAQIAGLPLARVQAGAPLPLREGVNPAWASALAALEASAVAPLLGAGKTALAASEWAALEAKLAPFQAWSAAKPATAVEKLGLERLRAVVASDARARIQKLIEQDKALEAEVAQIASIEKLLLLKRDLVRFLDNFVNFSEFYARRGAIFQSGTLYLDGRSCNLVLRVDDAGKHAGLAGLARSYLAYCDCVRPATSEKMTIAAAFTDGDSDNLLVGRNGIFYDRKGNDWDATITKVIENPISIREAFWIPYKRFVRMIEEQVAKRAATADASAHDKLSVAATATAHADRGKDATVEPSKKIDTGTVAALGVAIAGFATFLSTVLSAFFGLGRWIPLGVVGIILAISGPSMLIAWLKLRQRNLGPILDANGWAVNGRVKINVPFGGALTDVARLPANSERSFRDPYAEKKRPWKAWLVLALLAALAGVWWWGTLDGHLPREIRSTEVLPDWARVSSSSRTE